MAIAFDAASSTDSNNTLAHTTSGSDRFLTVALATPGGATASATYNGVAMSQLDAFEVTGVKIFVFTLAGPASGTNDIVITTSESFFALGAMSYTGVHQTTPLGSPDTDSGTSTGDTTNVTSPASTADDLCFSWVASNGSRTHTTDEGDFTERLDQQSIDALAGGDRPGQAGSTTMSWTIDSGTRNLGLGVALKPASGAGPTPTAADNRSYPRGVGRGIMRGVA